MKNSMTRNIIIIVTALLIVAILVCMGIYQLHKSYFRGATDVYIAVQQIPKSKITGKDRIWFNYDGATWERQIKVKSKNETLTYNYSMHYTDKSIILEVLRGRNDITSNKLEYPPLKYDQ